MPPARVLAGAAALLLLASYSVAQTNGNGSQFVTLTGFGTPVPQDFDSLNASGKTNTFLPAGWYFRKVGSTASNNYRAGDGTSATNDVYSFGTGTASDRTFGTLQGDTVTSVTIGVAFRNTTGATLGSVSITYTGEQWRLGEAGRTDRLDFAYQLSAAAPIDFSFLASGTYTDFDTLDFTAPVTAGTVGALDGNAAGNFTTLTATITNLNLADGQYLYLRWDDFNAGGTGPDDGLGIDNFSITANLAANPVPEPASVLTLAAGGLAVGAAVRHRLRRRL